MNKDKLYDAMKDAKIKKSQMCEALDISRTAFWRKANGISTFTVPEVRIISALCNLTEHDRDVIFFD